MSEGLCTVARVMTNAALLEHMVMSGSWAIIFFTLVTVIHVSFRFLETSSNSVATHKVAELCPSPLFGEG
jgi:hypothetical protein